jgi:hypothetical protein
MATKMPKFESEADEAEWWYSQRHVIAEEFVQGDPFMVEAGPVSSLRERRAAAKPASSRTQNTSAGTKLPRSA